MLPFHTQTCACMDFCLACVWREYRIACPFRYRACAFRYGAPTALQCPNGVHIWGRATPAVSKGVHRGGDRRCHGAANMAKTSVTWMRKLLELTSRRYSKPFGRSGWPLWSFSLRHLDQFLAQNKTLLFPY